MGGFLERFHRNKSRFLKCLLRSIVFFYKKGKHMLVAFYELDMLNNYEEYIVKHFGSIKILKTLPVWPSTQ